MKIATILATLLIGSIAMAEGPAGQPAAQKPAGHEMTENDTDAAAAPAGDMKKDKNMMHAKGKKAEKKEHKKK